MGIFAAIITGAIIGALARLFMKGKQPIGILWTIIIGIVAAVVGYYIAQAFGVADTNGFDWIRWIISVVLAIIGISIYLGVTNKKSVAK
ncbi:putative membrane protein YeaQ/YmgE (transglycosylase-associated protein family) [Antricoccus suffuscus]|uniref:Putative membrane protein YeaQ/YmgE (Transglycosylase-associated protein family) n=1 Tax=Antricoccus suffuscus TaxID=1629062 RepID=A0A2T1A763_9ACTN|nr:GlsB/YeaQ/YmgE family stress response membrane protein [Antricoccus suffuscus]PRZ44394.1 putative membrane protein YeaQ/YmgE (transglycosylase-associated protein family) [Antricoccus suffuscus]